MRQLKLWNKIKTQSIDLNSKNALASDVSGLGTNYSIDEINSTVARILPAFEDITLQIYFGIGGNAYSSYKQFIDFINSNGFDNLILEYQTGATPRYSDVYIRNAPKSQKNNFNVLTETVTLKRITPWYEQIEITAPGDSLTFETPLTNNYYLPIAVNLRIDLGFEGQYFPFIIKKSGSGEEISRVSVLLKGSNSLTIDSEKKVAYFTNTSTQEKTNAYDNIDHEHESFIVLERGSYTLQDPNGVPLIISYKKWVAD